jgi:hypothetical protein
MRPVPSRVAYRYLMGGLLEPPPGLYEDIRTWMVAQIAANELASKEESLKASQKYHEEHDRKFRELRKALGDLRAKPTSWAAYKEVYDLSWMFGHPGERWNIREFQKLTPEKIETLTRGSQNLTEGLEERIESDLAARVRWRKELQEEMTRLRGLLQPGVTPMTGDAVTKTFPVNLAGWKYGEDDIRRRLEERASRKLKKQEEWWAKMVERQGDNPELLKDVRELYDMTVEGLKKEWSSIRVQLTLKTSKEYAAYWQPALKTVLILMPYTAKPYDVERVERNLRHELIHMSQDILTNALSNADVFQEGTRRTPRPGLPSRHIMTPEMIQQYSPSRSVKLTPEQEREVVKLKSRGFNLYDMHSLDDIEFFTELADAIDSFKVALRYAPNLSDRVKRNAVRLFTGEISEPDRHREGWYEKWEALGGYDNLKPFQQNRFLGALRRSAMPKWRRAVAELVKAVL